MNKILVVDNDNDSRRLITRFLAEEGYAVSGAVNGQASIEWMKKNKPDLVLCDARLGDMTGLQLMGEIFKTYPEAMVIIITGYSNVKDAVEALKFGAFDYVTKPLFPEEILITIQKAFAKKNRVTVVTTPMKAGAKVAFGASAIYSTQYITGESSAFAEIIRQTELVAPTNYSVIIYGKSGSGKEAIAQQIHQKSKRADKPFVAIDCGALSKELSGSELFGHEKGAFTGALNQKIGCLEAAHEGTIFLDEIGNLPYEIQVSLLRVVQERKIRRVGGVKDIAIDVRIILASNIDLLEAVKAGKFREDLYHRFNEFSVSIPSLQERRQDIMLFATHFLKHTNQELGKNVKGFSKEAEYLLTNYVWHGNIRELKNAIKRATLLTDGDVVEIQSLPFEIRTFINAHPELPALKNMADEQLRRNTSISISYHPKTRKVIPQAVYSALQSN